MAEATTQERKNESQLNQDKAKTQVKPDNSGDSSTTGFDAVNPVELGLILGAAITVDLIDAADLTGVGAILVRFIDIPTLGALWLWRIMKHQAGPKKDPTFQLLIAFLAEISPFGILPTWSIFVVYVYLQDTKLGKKMIGKAQKLAKIKKAT